MLNLLINRQCKTSNYEKKRANLSPKDYVSKNYSTILHYNFCKIFKLNNLSL